MICFFCFFICFLFVFYLFFFVFWFFLDFWTCVVIKFSQLYIYIIFCTCIYALCTSPFRPLFTSRATLCKPSFPITLPLVGRVSVSSWVKGREFLSHGSLGGVTVWQRDGKGTGPSFLSKTHQRQDPSHPRSRAPVFPLPPVPSTGPPLSTPFLRAGGWTGHGVATGLRTAVGTDRGKHFARGPTPWDGPSLPWSLSGPLGSSLGFLVPSYLDAKSRKYTKDEDKTLRLWP